MQANTAQGEIEKPDGSATAPKRAASAWTAWALLYCGLLTLSLFLN